MWRKLTPAQHDRLMQLALAVAVGMRNGNRDLAPFIEDGAESVMWKLVRKGYVEAELYTSVRGKDRARYRPSPRGWALYDRWVASAAELELEEAPA